MDNSRMPRQSFKNFLVVFLAGLALVSGILLITGDQHYPLSGHPRFNTGVRLNYLKDMNELQPDLVLLGDSTLRWGIDGTRITEATGLKVEKIGIQGSASALWYLLIKNSIVQADHKPQAVVIFFRDTMLTDPGYRVTGEYFYKIDEYGTDGDENLIKKAFVLPRNWLDRLLLKYLPVYAERFSIQDWINQWMQPVFAEAINNCDYSCTEYAKAEAFAFGRLNPQVYYRDVDTAEAQLYTIDKMLFDRQYKRSFLPDIIRLCKRNGVKLILVGLQTSRYQSARDEPIMLQYYFSRLEKTLKDSGVDYIKWNYDNGITGVDYRDSIHLNESGREKFTQIFISEIEKVLETPE
jgi:hypothetical protein